MASRSLQTQQAGMEVAGHNLANVNTPGYSRQRVNIETSLTIPTQLGPQGTGADAVGIQQIRDALLDMQVQGEASVRGALDNQQKFLGVIQASVGQVIDQQAAGAEGAAAASGTGGDHALASDISGFFSSLQSLSANPTSSTERQSLLLKAGDLALQFNQVSTRLTQVRSSINDSIQSDVGSANALLGQIAQVNAEIVQTEVGGNKANDLRDTRQQQLEDLAKLVKFDQSTNANGSVNVSIGGTTFVAGGIVNDTLESYDAGGGQVLTRSQSGGANLTLTGGSIQGAIDTRDGALVDLQSDLDTLAKNLVSEVNTVHRAGYGLNGSTGADFFTGTDASTIAVNAAIKDDPSLVQAAGVSGAPGDNTVALALANLADKKVTALGSQTFLQSYSHTVARMGQSLNSTNSQLANQDIVESMLLRQRDSVSGVSLDEEMTDLVKYQRAYEASAKLIMTIDEMLITAVNLKQ